MQDSWFEDWFNSSYYHLLYNKRDEEEAEFFISNLCNTLHLPQESRVWDIACGKGRHTLAFARKGYYATGTDLSENSIKEALLLGDEKLEFFVHDMRRTFRINYFDCAVNLFTSIGYFKNPNDNLSVFKNVHSALKPNGYFIVDFFNAEKVKATYKSDYIESRETIDFHIRKHVKNNVIYKTIEFSDNGKNYSFEESVSLLGLNDFETLAKKSGFKILNIFGDYSLNAFNPAKSDRLILIFDK